LKKIKSFKLKKIIFYFIFFFKYSYQNIEDKIFCKIKLIMKKYYVWKVIRKRLQKTPKKVTQKKFSKKSIKRSWKKKHILSKNDKSKKIKP